MESTLSSNENAPSFPHLFGLNGFKSIDVSPQKEIPLLSGLSLNSSSIPSSFHCCPDQFYSKIGQESKTSNLIDIVCSNGINQKSEQIKTLNLFPLTPTDSPKSESNDGSLPIMNGLDSNGNTQMHKPIKSQWNQEEDSKLIELVTKYGKRWAHISSKLGGRIGKQCRERWENHLHPNLKKDKWTDEEKQKLIVAHKQVGTTWIGLSKRIPGRSENSIKNIWNATKRKLQRALRKGDVQFTPLETYIHSFLSNDPIQIRAQQQPKKSLSEKQMVWIHQPSMGSDLPHDP